MARKKIVGNYYEKIPKPIRNKYALTLLAFAVWMLFFDRNDVFTQFKLGSTLNDLQQKNTHYVSKLDEVNASAKDLSENKEEQERFARETYLMKKDNEEVFVIKHKE